MAGIIFLDSLASYMPALVQARESNVQKRDLRRRMRRSRFAQRENKPQREAREVKSGP